MADKFNLITELDQRGEGWPFEALEGTTEIRNFVYATPTPVDDPLPQMIDKYEYVNDTDGPATLDWSNSTVSTATVGWEFQKAMSFSQTVTLNFPLPFPVPKEADGGPGGNVQINHKVDITETISQSHSYQQTFSYSINQPLPTPRRRYEAQVMVLAVTYRTDFTAQAIVTGRIKWLKIGFGVPDKIRYDNIGDLFSKYPSPRVTVLGADAVAVDIAGTLSGKCGRTVHVEVHQFPLP